MKTLRTERRLAVQGAIDHPARAPEAAALPLAVFIHGSADLYGSDKVFLNILSHLVQSRRFRPCVVLHEDGPLRSSLEACGVEVHVSPVGKITRAMLGLRAPFAMTAALLRARSRIDRIVRGRPVGLVYSNTLAVLGGAAWSWRRGVPHLWHVHEIVVSPRVVGRGLAWLVDRFATAVICNSQRTRDWLITQAPHTAGRTTVVFNGTPVAEAVDADASREFRVRHGLPDGAVLVTLAGRLNRMKGQSLLIAALRILHERGELGQLHALIVGDTNPGQSFIRDDLMRHVAAAGLTERIRFLPFVADIASVWAITDIACVPSIEPESFGMVAIEAMALAKPVIGAAHGGLLDVICDRETGLLFRPGDAAGLAAAIAELASDPDRRCRMGEAGRARQREHFSLERQCRQTLELCEATIQR